MTRLFLALLVALAGGTALADDGAVQRGAYLFAASGCVGCHSAKDDAKRGVLNAGGRALKTPFGTFFTPNITSDKDFGIGKWTFDDFDRAVRQGKRPGGGAYFPVFPYPSYSAMTDADIADLWAYVQTLSPVQRQNKAHEADAPFGWRLTATLWQTVFFDPAPPAPGRGAYLVKVLGHCGECHTPRDAVGRTEPKRAFSGVAATKGQPKVPNITSDMATGIGKWTESDLGALFSYGMLPDGDFVGGHMAEVVENTTNVWTASDRAAAIGYIRGLAPLPAPYPAKKASPKKEDWE